jgi:hypothetical protein
LEKWNDGRMGTPPRESSTAVNLRFELKKIHTHKSEKRFKIAVDEPFKFAGRCERDENDGRMPRVMRWQESLRMREGSLNLNKIFTSFSSIGKGRASPA